MGAPIAAVVAEDRYLAEEDAVELVDVEYEALAAVASMEAALAEGAAKLYEDWPDNRIVHLLLSLADVEEV